MLRVEAVTTPSPTKPFINRAMLGCDRLRRTGRSTCIAKISADQRRADLIARSRPPTTLASGRLLSASTYKRAVRPFGEDRNAELFYLVGGYCRVSLLLNASDMSVTGREEGPAPGHARASCGLSGHPGSAQPVERLPDARTAHAPHTRLIDRLGIESYRNSGGASCVNIRTGQ
ncbi:MAG: hypothetical protein V4595_00130 [Pseudomonadota bacterium]